MDIHISAFKNCIALKEIHLEKCKFSINTNIYKANVQDDLKIIIKDNMYQDSLKTEIRANHYRLFNYSEYIQKKIDLIPNTKIIQSIIYIDRFIQSSNNLDIIRVLKDLIENLKTKYIISNDSIKYIDYLLNKKQEIIQNGS